MINSYKGIQNFKGYTLGEGKGYVSDKSCVKKSYKGFLEDK